MASGWTIQSRPISDRPSRLIRSRPGRPDERAGADLRSPPERTSGALLAAGYLIYGVAGVLCAVFEVLLVPTRWGSTLVPIAPVLAVASNVALPVICRRLTGTTGSALPPVMGWLVAAFALASTRPEGDVLLPAGDTAWVSYGVLFGGALAAMLTLVLAGRGFGGFGRFGGFGGLGGRQLPPADSGQVRPAGTDPGPARSPALRPLPRPRHGPARSGSGSGDAR